MPEVLQEYHLRLFNMGRKSPTMRAAINALRAVETLEWIPKSVQDKHWTMARVAQAELGDNRPYGRCAGLDGQACGDAQRLESSGMCNTIWGLNNCFLAYGPPNPWRGSQVQTPGTPGRPSHMAPCR